MTKVTTEKEDRPLNVASQALALCIRYATQIGSSQRALRTLPSNLAHYAHITALEKDPTQKALAGKEKEKETKGSPAKSTSKVCIFIIYMVWVH